jgi:hypothetical protein
MYSDRGGKLSYPLNKLIHEFQGFFTNHNRVYVSTILDELLKKMIPYFIIGGA